LTPGLIYSDRQNPDLPIAVVDPVVLTALVALVAQAAANQ